MPQVPTSEGTPLELLTPEAQGGMGYVWRARYTCDSTPLAVKVLTRLSEHPELRSTFLTEVRAQAELRHPGVAQIYGFGETMETVDLEDTPSVRAGTPYLAMEWTKFGTLRDFDGPHRWRSLRRLLVQILDALSYAHARDVVHCDLKPANILLFDEGGGRRRFKLTDFGVAHALERSGPRETEDVMHPDAGTPTYMAPEQLEAQWRTFGAWTDLYALGCVAFEAAAGHPPYDGDNIVEMATGHLDEPVPELDSQFPVPDGFQTWLETMLARDFKHRFRWAAGAAAALEQLEEPEASPAPESTEDSSEARTTRRWESTQLRVEERDRSGGEKGDSERPSLVGPRTLPEGIGELGSDAAVHSGGSHTHPFDPPAMPPDWRRPEAMRPDPPPQLSERLFELRETPFVGREREREIIWEMLEEVVDRERPGAILIEGPPGSGRTRLARWMGCRARELGQATFLEAAFEPAQPARRELPSVIHSWFRTWGLDRDAGTEIIRNKLESLTPDEANEAQIDRLTAWLTESVFGDDDLHREMYDDRESRISFHARILRLIDLEDPLFVLLDDIEWAEDTIEFACRVLESSSSTPALFVATYDPDATSDEPRSLPAFRDAESTRQLELGPLSDSARRELVRRLTAPGVAQLEHLADEAGRLPGRFVDRIRDAIEQ